MTIRVLLILVFAHSAPLVGHEPAQTRNTPRSGINITTLGKGKKSRIALNSSSRFKVVCGLSPSHILHSFLLAADVAKLECPRPAHSGDTYTLYYDPLQPRTTLLEALIQCKWCLSIFCISQKQQRQFRPRDIKKKTHYKENESECAYTLITATPKTIRLPKGKL